MRDKEEEEGGPFSPCPPNPLSQPRDLHLLLVVLQVHVVWRKEAELDRSVPSRSAQIG